VKMLSPVNACIASMSIFIAGSASLVFRYSFCCLIPAASTGGAGIFSRAVDTSSDCHNP
jgi:hypothetical protein